jgi:HSP20 family protein
MNRDDRDDPFDDFFQALDRMRNEMMSGEFYMHVERPEGDHGPTTDPHLDVYE